MQPRSCQERESAPGSRLVFRAPSPHRRGTRRRQRRTRSMVHGKNRIPYWIDRRLTGLAGPDYDATISFGLPFESEDSQYGKYRLICHPRLVQTGLDLVDFPTICWMETDYSVYTMRQGFAPLVAHRPDQARQGRLHGLQEQPPGRRAQAGGQEATEFPGGGEASCQRTGWPHTATTETT